MRQPVYTPYDGSARLFTIGLGQLDPARWIEPDDELERYLAEKDRLLAGCRDVVFVEEADTRAAQQEVLDLLAAHVTARHPSFYRRAGSTIVAGRRTVDLDAGEAPLVTAGALVQDDLVLMRRDESGWRLVAGYVAFPSSWSLIEKFGRRMEDIHAPVPDFGEGTRNALLINRMFDNLKAEQPVFRFNWSINPDADLHYPASKAHGALPEDHRLSLETTFARVERQTLRKLPACGDILFTIRIYTDPLAAVRTLPDAGRVATVFADQLEALTLPQAEYKGLAGRRAALVAELRAVAAG
ncbi:heme-dependent oxidative N-demethylase family protein [Shinella sp. BYT-45]|uniref:heme-dependent oxidative N-demethylase family protein n=1 Tax=Shinella sp. BYT-45 TaxID=3377377 RepID=UPI0039810DE0